MHVCIDAGNSKPLVIGWAPPAKGSMQAFIGYRRVRLPGTDSAITEIVVIPVRPLVDSDGIGRWCWAPEHAQDAALLPGFRALPPREDDSVT